MQSGGGNDFPGPAGFPTGRRRRLRPPLAYIVLAILLVTIGFVGANTWLNWSILEYMYSAKAGLDWFSINYYGGLTFVVSGILALLFVNPIPRRSDLFEALNSMLGLQYRRGPLSGRYTDGVFPQKRRTARLRPFYLRPSLLLWGFWQALKWLVLFVIFVGANGFPLFSNLTIVADLALKGFGSWGLVPRVFLLPLFSASGEEIISLIPTMEIQYQLLAYFLTTLALVISIRFLLKFVRDSVARTGDKWLRDIFVLLSAITLMILLNVPYWAMDVRIPFEFGAIATALAGFVGASYYFHSETNRDTLPLRERGRAGILVATIVILALLILNVGALAYYTLNLNNNWISYEWQPLNQKQITVTRWTAGIDNMNYSSISSLPPGNTTKTLSLIRDWSSNATLTQSRNRIGVNWLQLVSQPEIVYVYNHEYWVTPTTFDYPNPSDWVAVHLVYTHTSKIIVMDSHTGQFVNATQAFELKNQPLIYYGEDIPQGSPGFANDVYVHVKTNPAEIENVSYSGAPDYTLCGAQRGLWFFGQGPTTWGFAFTPPQNCIDMLHVRNVFDRVSNVLIYGLWEDTSTYLVTDSPAGGDNLYYAIQVYIDYPLHSSFSSIPSGPEAGSMDYMRLFGVVLVNVADGSMQGYTLTNDTGFLTLFYKQYYPSWGPAPSWLRSQLRYPDQLLGNQQYIGQLDADFILHVNDPSTFRAGSDFYERPANTEVLYIPFVIGNNVSFTAVQLVEYAGSNGKNLAGLYVIYGGDRLGQMYLYEANTTGTNPSPLLGPTAALSAFGNDPTTKTAMTLTGATPGNILLYPIAGHLYYFIPAYILQQSGTGVIARNPFIDVIDAQNSSAYVRFVNTTSTGFLNYGFNNFASPTNQSSRESYIEGLFRSAGITLNNATITFTNTQDNVGSSTYNSDAENASATAFVESFIHSYIENPAITNSTWQWTPRGTVFYWMANSYTLDFGFIVTNQGITESYIISVNVGS